MISMVMERNCKLCVVLVHIKVSKASMILIKSSEEVILLVLSEALVDPILVNFPLELAKYIYFHHACI